MTRYYGRFWPPISTSSTVELFTIYSQKPACLVEIYDAAQPASGQLITRTEIGVAGGDRRIIPDVLTGDGLFFVVTETVDG